MTVTSADAKLQERRRKQQIKVLVRSLISVLVAIVLGVGVWIVWFSDILTVTTVTVTGTKIVTVAEIEQAAAVPIGEPLARISIDPMARRVAEIPPVDTVTIRREWPHAIVIDIVERVALVAVPIDSGVVLVDKAGVKFQVVPDPPFGVVVAKVPESQPELVSDCATVVAKLSTAVRNRVQKIEAKGQDSITLTLRKGEGTIFWGSSSDNELKAQVLEKLLAVKAKHYDVSAPTHPATKD